MPQQSKPTLPSCSPTPSSKSMSSDESSRSPDRLRRTPPSRPPNPTPYSQKQSIVGNYPSGLLYAPESSATIDLSAVQDRFRSPKGALSQNVGFTGSVQQPSYQITPASDLRMPFHERRRDRTVIEWHPAQGDRGTIADPREDRVEAMRQDVVMDSTYGSIDVRRPLVLQREGRQRDVLDAPTYDDQKVLKRKGRVGILKRGEQKAEDVDEEADGEIQEEEGKDDDSDSPHAERSKSRSRYPPDNSGSGASSITIRPGKLYQRY